MMMTVMVKMLLIDDHDKYKKKINGENDEIRGALKFFFSTVYKNGPQLLVNINYNIVIWFFHRILNSVLQNVAAIVRYT